MGKTGAYELNYLSDVDVIFVAEPLAGADGADTPDRDEGKALATATNLASHMMRICGAAAWEVDAALRPEGKQGPLVRTLASHVAYYTRWASTWEFQALLKAHPAAGDGVLGRRYLDVVGPMVWKAAERENFVSDVQAMRRRVVAHLPAAIAPRELKLGPGGLRDVEFAVQLLQLVHGRADESLRVSATLPALRALRDGGYVGVDDAVSLDDAYRFLRSAEHALQLRRLRRTHTLPDDDRAMAILARTMGFRPDVRGDARDVWDSEWALHVREVRRLHEKLFYRPLLEAVARVPSDQLRLTAGGGGAAAGRARVRPAGRGAAAHRGADGRVDAPGRAAAGAAAGDARVLLPGAGPGCRAAGLPAGLRGARRHAVVPAPAAGRWRGRLAARLPARHQPLRRRHAGARAGGAADAGRRRGARARGPGRDSGHHAGGGAAAGVAGRRGGDHSRGPSAGAAADGLRRSAGRRRRASTTNQAITDVTDATLDATLGVAMSAVASETRADRSCRCASPSSPWAASAVRRPATAPTRTSCSSSSRTPATTVTRPTRNSVSRMAMASPSACARCCRRRRATRRWRSMRTCVRRAHPARWCARSRPTQLLRAVVLGVGGAGAVACPVPRRRRRPRTAIRRDDRPDAIPGGRRHARPTCSRSAG